jgi:hypothetical protein
VLRPVRGLNQLVPRFRISTSSTGRYCGGVEAEFAEKHFENLANQELGFNFASDQVNEYRLGYDAIAHPKPWNPVWAVLGHPRPAGQILAPSDWLGSPNGLPPATAFPPFAYSLVLQYKRPEYIRSHAALHWRLWHAPHYRFEVTAHQQDVLAALESNIGTNALVRYAAPAFHTNDVLYAHMLTGTVMTHSGFVAPSTLTGHRFWTYQTPGVDGLANPPQASLFESVENVRQSVESGLGQAVLATDYLLVVADAIRKSVFGTPFEEFVVSPQFARLQEFASTRAVRQIVEAVELIRRFALATDVRWTLLLAGSTTPVNSEAT